MFPYFFKRKDITMKNFNCFNKEKILLMQIHTKFKELEKLLSQTRFSGIYKILCGLETVLIQEEKEI